MPGRRLSILLSVLWLILGLALWWAGRPVPPEASRPDPRLGLYKVAFAVLPEWEIGRQGEAVPAFLESCERFAKWPDARSLGRNGIGGRAGDWRQACAAMGAVDAADHAAARRAFEAEFRAFRITWGEADDGLFTGYYEPLLSGSREKRDGFEVPLHRRPGDLVVVELGQFNAKLKGKVIRGRISKGRLRPYPDRAAIETGAVAASDALVWVDSAIDAFFLHIQGSGRVRLVEGGEMRVGYAEQNGRKYVAVGQELIRRRALSRQNVSMQSIRAWLEANASEAEAVMNLNPSYIFFRELKGPGPIGAMGVPLTAGRSLAIDRHHLPLGAPMWLDGAAPNPDPARPDEVVRRLMVAQDTGGAIKGGLRGDVFWGHGKDGREIAGRMKHRGRLFLLLPTAAAEKLP